MHAGKSKDEGNRSIAIETKRLCRDFGEIQAVQDLDITVERASFFGFLGSNGAGKSTTIKMLTGLLAPSQGSLSVLGRDPTDPAQALELKQKIGVVPENLALFDHLTAREYLTFIGRMYLLPPETIRSRSEELLALMELDGDDRKYTMEFSHGMRKKLALAAALIADPELIFLDEPFEGVDAVSSRMLRKVLQRFVHQGGTIFLTSHILEIVEKLCTHVAIISKGKLIHQSSMETLRGDRSLEERFLEVLGPDKGETRHLSWYETRP